MRHYARKELHLKRTAQCCCGVVVLEVTGEPKQHGICHCNNCKKRTGSAFGMSVYFLKEYVERVAGNPSCYRLTNPNDGADQERYFCSECGTTLYWSVSSLPGLIGVAGGCFGEAPLERPSYSTSHSSKYSWLEVSSSLKKLG